MLALDDLTQSFTVEVMTGMPDFAAVRAIEAQLYADAEVPLSQMDTARRASPTTFHIASDHTRRPLGVGCSVVGSFADLPLGLHLRALGHDLPDHELLPDPVCELVSMAITHGASDERVHGLTETMYRSFYQRALASRAVSIALAVEPWLLDVLADEYGIPLQPLGPVIETGGRELVPAGGRLADLEIAVAEQNPDFAGFLGIPA